MKQQSGFSLIELLAVTVVVGVILAGVFVAWPAANLRADTANWVHETQLAIDGVREHWGEDIYYTDIPTSASEYRFALPASMRTGTTGVRAVTGGSLVLRRCSGTGWIQGYGANECFEIDQRGFTQEQCIRYVRGIDSIVRTIYINNTRVKNRGVLSSTYARRCIAGNNRIRLRSA